MTRTQTLAKPISSFTSAPTGILQRKCACGARTSGEAKCSKCDIEEKEHLSLQRKPARAADVDEVPPIVHEVLRSSGQPLDAAARAYMEPRFGHDFSRVRVHTDSAAERSARDVNAHAYTVGQHIVFGIAQFVPGTHIGHKLLAHELAHVVQQSASVSTRKISIGSVDSPEEAEAERVADRIDAISGPIHRLGTTDASVTLRAQPKKQAPANTTSTVPKICGRPSRNVSGNLITRVILDVGANTLTIEWQNQTNIPTSSAGTHRISPGAGRCCVDCNDDTVSQTSGSLCTPKGGQWPVDSTACALSGHPTAKNPTYFQRRGVAIHSGNTASPPQSHGCARTSVEISELIHDNVVRGQTQIASSGSWTGKKCYLNAASASLSNRKDVCDGNTLKRNNKGKKAERKSRPLEKPNVPGELPAESPAPKTPIPISVALPVESDILATIEELELGVEIQPEMIVDGPGPNNEPLSYEGIDELPIADLGLEVNT